MKKGLKLFSFLFVVCLLLGAIVAAFVVVNGGTGGFMTRATEKTKFNCSLITSRGRTFCNAKNLCKWVGAGEKKGFCASKLTVPSSKCDTLGDTCCTNTTSGQGYCRGAVTCNPTTYNCVASQTGLGQERGEKGTCAKQFKGATCMWRSDCRKQTPIGIPTSGYCKGPVEWQCCVPFSAGN